MKLSSKIEPAEQIRVSLKERSYDILIGSDLLDAAGTLIAKGIETSKAYIVTDSNVSTHYANRLISSLNNAGIENDIIIHEPGEKTKSFKVFEGLLNTIIEKGVERSNTLIALGGGVVGDITGFAASTILRGINYVQIPTTLLAQVDSSVGGKTAINSSSGKNLIGSFYQPKLVLADLRTLETVPERELLAGYAETVKYGLIGDSVFFSWLEKNGENLLKGEQSYLIHAIATSCKMKSEIVAQDEKEKGERALLNLGHTFAHALESEVGFDNHILHGEAVAIGICLAFNLSTNLGLCPISDTERVQKHFRSIGLSVEPPEHPSGEWKIDAIMKLIGLDKKVVNNHPVFILSKGIGSSFIADDVPLNEVRQLLENTFLG